MHSEQLPQIATQIRRLVLQATTAAGSGHPTSCLSATDLMTAIMFGGAFQADLKDPKNPNNDRLIFSKGHAAPLFYTLYQIAGVISLEELMTLRQFGSRLEGHPTMNFPYTEAATGSLGQGLGVGLGLAIGQSMDYQDKKLVRLPKTWVLLGDSEMAEGSVWESLALAKEYQLDNLIGVLDLNRLGQRGETMHGHDLQIYVDKIKAFGWEVWSVDGHNLQQIEAALQQILNSDSRQPKMLIGKTYKGAGVSFLQDQLNWHGKALNEEQLAAALKELDSTEITQASVKNFA